MAPLVDGRAQDIAKKWEIKLYSDSLKSDENLKRFIPAPVFSGDSVRPES